MPEDRPLPAALAVDPPDAGRRLLVRSTLQGAGLALGACASVIFVYYDTASLASTIVALAAVTLGAGALAAAQVSRDLQLVSRIDRAVARVRNGQEVSRIETEDLGATEPIAALCNELFDALSEATMPALERLVRLELIPDRAVAALENVGRSAEDQEGAVEEVASLMRNINASIRQINERMDTLSGSADDASASIIEMGSAVESVAQSASRLTDSMETASSSVHEMGSSIRQVSSAASEVQAMAEDTAAAMVEIDRSTNEVSEHVREAASLTSKVSEGAEQGSIAVFETIADIGDIESRTREAREVVEKLARRIVEISKIVTVIDEISDETNLLSLNAAIIAAQAGEHGRAFLVVANHVKMLARRTTASTQDIEELIRSVQHESDNAVAAMGAGIDAIEQGVSRSRRAGDALQTIRQSALAASERVAEIERASTEQAHSSKGVADGALNTSTQIQQITSAIQEQLRATEQLLECHEEARQLCGHVHRSTEEQRSSGRYIRESTEAIVEMIRGVQGNTATHAEASEAVSEAVTRLLENAQRSSEPLPELAELLADLRTNAQETVSELSRFQAAARRF